MAKNLGEAIGSLFHHGGSGSAPAGGDGLPIQQQSFFTRFAHSLLGKPDSELTPEELKQRQAKQARAIESAKGAMDNQGESYMDPPSASDIKGGLGLGDLIKGIGSLFK